MASCELCNDFGPGKIKYNLESAKEHANTHFPQLNIIDDEVSADQVFEKCFPASPQNAARSGPPAKSLSRQIFVDLCHTLFPQKRILDSPSHLACIKCGLEYKLITRKYLNTNAIIDHATSHLDEKEMYACNHCSRKFKTHRAIRGHLVHVHHIISIHGHFENETHNFVKEISDQIKSCFGPNEKKMDIDAKWASTDARIRRMHKGSELAIKRQLLCHQLTSKIVDRNQSIKCRLCSSRLSVKHKAGHSSCAAMHHALLHLQKPIKRCRICSEVFSSFAMLQKHLKNIHTLPSTNNFICFEDEFHTEILALLQKCYGTNAGGTGIEHALAPKSVRGARRGSKLAIDRKLLCHRLIRMFANREKKLQCRLCSKWIKANDKDSTWRIDCVMLHAHRHLAKPLFRCKQCSMAYTCSAVMANHLRTKHALPLDKNYVCFQDKYHSEIFAILRACYGDERERDGDAKPE